MADEQPPPDPTRRATPHDALFKLAFSQPRHAEGMLRALLPPEALERFDFTTLELVPGSFHDVDLYDVEADLLFRVASAGDEEVFVYALLEHQSRVDELMAWRLLRYMTRIWESWTRQHPRARRLPPIIPLVIAHGERPWTAPRTFGELLNIDARVREALSPWLVDFAFVLKDLTAQGAEAITAPTLSSMARITLFLLQNGRGSADLLEDLRQRLGDVREVHGRGGDDLAFVVMYTDAVGKVDPARWRAFLRDELQTDPEPVMGAAEKFAEMVGPWLREQSENRVREARHEGRAEGQAELVLKLLATRFGPVTSEVDARVRAATAAELEGIVERVFAAQSLSEALG